MSKGKNSKQANAKRERQKRRRDEKRNRTKAERKARRADIKRTSKVGVRRNTSKEEDTEQLHAIVKETLNQAVGHKPSVNAAQLFDQHMALQQSKTAEGRGR